MDSLTATQRDALEYARSQYSWWCQDRTGAGLENAFNALAEHIDDVSCMDYRILFADVVEDMQKENWNLSPACVDTKIKIYFDAVKYYYQHRNDDVSCPWIVPYIWSALNSFAALLLTGEDGVPQDDYTAWICFSLNRMLGHPVVGMLLEDFNSEQVYTGNRDQFKRKKGN